VLPPFQAARGVLEDVVETNVFPQPTASGGFTVAFHASATSVFTAAAAQNIPIITLTPVTIDQVQSLAISADAKARITTALQAGKDVVVPTQGPTIEGKPAIAWYEIDPITGDTVGVGEDGAHQELIFYAGVSLLFVSSLILFRSSAGAIAGDAHV